LKKVLFTAHIDQHIRHFHIPYLRWFQENNYETHVASNGNETLESTDKKHNVSFSRNPLSITNIKGYFQLKKIIKTEGFEVIHCHTPVGGMITRLAAISSRKKGTQVIYTAHGFHFYKGSNFKNWLIYYNVEKILSYFTDTIITINEEDYQTAVNKNFKSNNIEKVNGVGIDLKKYKIIDPLQKTKIRENLKLKNEDFILVYVAELSVRKNQEVLIEAINLIKNKIPNIKLLLVGKGKDEKKLKEKIFQYNLENNIRLLGYRKDVNEIMGMADVSISSANQEGLPVNILESMACGLPLIVSDCRGNVDLIENEKNGYVVKKDSSKEFADKILTMYKNSSNEIFIKNNLEKVKDYEIQKIIKNMSEIYKIKEG